MLRNCPTHGLNLWIIIQNFYAGSNFFSRNLLDSTVAGTFLEITLGEATKLLDNIMVNYSQDQRVPIIIIRLISIGITIIIRGILGKGLGLKLPL